jgi:predicted hydrocarbon binding protein
MNGTENTIAWDITRGSIMLSRNGADERIIMMRKGFMEAFFQEIEEVEGKNVLTMTIRNLMKKMGAADGHPEAPSFETLSRFENDYMLPLGPTNGNVPSAISINGGGRELQAFGDTAFMLESLQMIQTFKEVTADILTEKGAAAVFHAVARRGGKAVAEQVMKNYRWTGIDTAMDSMDASLSATFPLFGWGNVRVITKKDENGRYLFYARCDNTFESHERKTSAPTCILFQRYLEGIADVMFSELADATCESREVKCRAMGDDYCAFAIKEKPKGSGALDWDALTDEWLAIDRSMHSS